MRKTSLAVTTAAAVAALGITVAATASGGTKTEHFSFMDTSNTSQVHSVIATGAFTGGGSILLKHSGASTMHLSDGTINVTPHFTQAPQTNVNTTICMVTEHSSGTYTLSHGTGIYKRISGSGKFTQSARQIGPTPHGKCSFTSGNPVASQQTLSANGPVSVP